jgi:hypothetical protein
MCGQYFEHQNYVAILLMDREFMKLEQAKSDQ